MEGSPKCTCNCFWFQVTRSACHLWPPSRIQVCALQQRLSDLHITTTHVSCWTQTYLDPPHLLSDLLKNPFVLFGGILFLWLLLAACGWLCEEFFLVFSTSVAVHYEGHDLCMWMTDRKEWSISRGFTVNEHANLMLFVPSCVPKCSGFSMVPFARLVDQHFKVVSGPCSHVAAIFRLYNCKNTHVNLINPYFLYKTQYFMLFI